MKADKQKGAPILIAIFPLSNASTYGNNSETQSQTVELVLGTRQSWCGSRKAGSPLRRHHHRSNTKRCSFHLPSIPPKAPL